MSKSLIRIYQKRDCAEIKKHLLIYGTLAGSCANCQHMDLKLETKLCPECGTEFKFVSFRNVKVHLPRIKKLIEQCPSQAIIDFEDYQRSSSVSKAQNLLGDM